MNDTDITIDERWLAETERLAGEATAGPWKVVKRGNTIQFYSIPGVCSGISPLTGNAAHIARVDPAAVTAWARETRRAWAEEARLRDTQLIVTSETMIDGRDIDFWYEKATEFRATLEKIKTYQVSSPEEADALLPIAWASRLALCCMAASAALRADAPARPEGE